MSGLATGPEAVPKRGGFCRSARRPSRRRDGDPGVFGAARALLELLDVARGVGRHAVDLLRAPEDPVQLDEHLVAGPDRTPEARAPALDDSVVTASTGSSPNGDSRWTWIVE
jgi:hypothetical protein